LFLVTEPPEPNALKDLDARLKAARDEQRAGKPLAREDRDSQDRAQGMAWRIAIEMVVAVAFGGYVGWLLDNWLGTLPLFLVVLFLLGAGAGMRNVFRVARDMNPEAEEKQDKQGGTK
jgi:ATP synthase protein I